MRKLKDDGGEPYTVLYAMHVLISKDLFLKPTLRDHFRYPLASDLAGLELDVRVLVASAEAILQVILLFGLASDFWRMRGTEHAVGQQHQGQIGHASEPVRIWYKGDKCASLPNRRAAGGRLVDEVSLPT